MSLLREIQGAVACNDGDVIRALRMCKILSARLHSEDLARWVDFELDGYPMFQPVPEYRRLSVSCYGNFRNLAWSAQNQPLPRFAVPDDVAEAVFSPIEFREGITIAMTYAKTGATIDVPALAVHVSKHRVMYPGMECTNAWRRVSAPDFQQLISAVTNRILDFSLKIEAENPTAGEALPDTQPVPPEKLQPLVQNVFYGNIGNISQNSEHFTQTATFGVPPQDLRKLVTEFTSHLDELKLDVRQRQRAEAQLATLKAELSGEPDPTIVKQAGRSLRTITEGAISSLLATAVQQPTVWHWIHQTLSAFTA